MGFDAPPFGTGVAMSRQSTAVWAVCCPLVLLALACWAAGDEEAALRRARADRAYHPLSARFKQGGDRAKLVEDLHTFRRTFAGTPQAVQAAGLLSQLPAPSDALTAQAIPQLERFKWQPEELVAVLG